jgi:hypothetical protein
VHFSLLVHPEIKVTVTKIWGSTRPSPSPVIMFLNTIHGYSDLLAVCGIVFLNLLIT